MAITPTTMIAAQGMLSGGGVGVNSDMTSAISAATSNPVVGGVTSLQAQATALAVSNPTAAASITASLATLPSSFSSVASSASSATTQATAMAPDVKTFISLHNSTTAFGSASTEYGAALANFGDKSFGDLGIGVSSFTDANSGGLTSAIPGFGAFANKAKTDAFGSIGANLDPALLAKGQASMASTALSDGLSGVGTGLQNFGTLMDFKNPQSLGYQGMLSGLQKQGLADSVGINDGIMVAGFDPKNPANIPDVVLKDVFDGVSPGDLQKIISQTGVKPVAPVTSLNDLLDPSKIMPAGAVAAMGLTPGSGVTGLKGVGNILTNIGVPLDNMSAGSLLGGIQTKVGGYLSGLTSLIPASVSTTLKSSLGSGSSLFGTPSMSDMMGSLAGTHTSDFAAANTQLSSVASSSQGQAISGAMTAVLAAISSGSGLTAALSALTSASSLFASQASSNSALSSALGSVSGAASSVAGRLSAETSNLSLAGVNLSSMPALPGGSGMILNFASKLHSFGVDKLQLGHGDIFNGVATNDLTGDAIKASLLEGKSVAKMAAVGKTAPTVSDTNAALATANANNIDSLINDYDVAQANYKTAKDNVVLAKSQFMAIDAQYRPNPDDQGLRAQWLPAKTAYQNSLTAYMSAADATSTIRNKMADAALNSAGTDASTKVTAAIQKYLA